MENPFFAENFSKKNFVMLWKSVMDGDDLLNKLHLLDYLLAKKMDQPRRYDADTQALGDLLANTQPADLSNDQRAAILSIANRLADRERATPIPTEVFTALADHELHLDLAFLNLILRLAVTPADWKNAIQTLAKMNQKHEFADVNELLELFSGRSGPVLSGGQAAVQAALLNYLQDWDNGVIKNMSAEIADVILREYSAITTALWRPVVKNALIAVQTGGGQRPTFS